MDNKKETSFIEIVKSRISGRGLKKDQLLILLLLGILLLVIAIPAGDEDEGTEKAFFRDGSVSDTEKDTPADKSIQNTGLAQQEGIYYEEVYAGKLEDLLSQVEGVGQVRVLIRVKGSAERVVEKDVPFRESSQTGTDETGSTRTEKETEQEETTVYEETQDGRQTPYVIKEYAPQIEGVIVAAQGADRPEVLQDILEAVQALLQVEVHKIKVLKMK